MGRIEVRVGELMARRRMNMMDLSRQMGVAYETARSLWHGNMEAIRFDTLVKLCEFFDCQVGEILEYVPGEESRSG